MELPNNVSKFIIAFLKAEISHFIMKVNNIFPVVFLMIETDGSRLSCHWRFEREQYHAANITKQKKDESLLSSQVMLHLV